MNLTSQKYSFTLITFYNKIPSEFDYDDNELMNKINSFLEGFTPTENQEEIFKIILDKFINLGFSDVLLNEVLISKTIEDEILFTKSTEDGVKILFIDEDGDVGYNNTPFNENPTSVFVDYNEELKEVCLDFVV